MNKDDPQNPQNLRKIDILGVKDQTRLVNEVIGLIETHDITDTNKPIKCGALVINQLLSKREQKEEAGRTILEKN